MRRTTTLTSATVLGLALLAPATGASAAVEMCHGETATIVGTPGRPLVGTAGADVILTGGASQVSALGGDDLICISGPLSPFVTVDAGDGDDVVDGTGSRQAVFATLGAGTDVFHGGDGADRVTLDYPDVAAGTDAVQGGGGPDALFLQTGAGDAVIDNAAGSFASAGVVRTTWTGLEEFWLAEPPAPRDLAFVGSDTDDLVVDQSRQSTRVDVDLAGGDDSWRRAEPPAATSTVQGGQGRDEVYVASELAELRLDLRRARLWVVDGSTTAVVAATGFEDAEVFARRVIISGTDGPNELNLTACHGSVRGRAGADRVRRAYDGTFETDLDCRERLVIDGGKGHDRLSGSRSRDVIRGGPGNDVLDGMGGDDVLLGGPGRDRVDGNRGRDRCVAERKARCER